MDDTERQALVDSIAEAWLAYFKTYGYRDLIELAVDATLAVTSREVP